MKEKVKISINVDKKIYKKVDPNDSLLVTIKKIESCCSIIIDPIVKVISLDQLDSLKKAKRVTTSIKNGLIIGISLEIFQFYPKTIEFNIKRGGLFKNQLKIDLPPDIIQKDDCVK